MALYWLNPDYFWWLTPIIGALILSVPLSVLREPRAAGRPRARALGLFLIPEETAPPPELRDARGQHRRGTPPRGSASPPAERDGFVRAVVDPYVNALHLWLLRRPRSLKPSIDAKRSVLVERALAEGPAALDERERRMLLLDARRLEELHRHVWELDRAEQARLWGRPGAEV